ncbi:MAG: 5-carboxymethyl-2-hydroxymuconate isomerase [Burkholderiaceae bacterium]
MPHLVILYTPNIEGQTDMSLLCRRLADAMIGVKDETGKPVFPVGGTRVFAYPAAYFAVADGSGDHAFIYFNLRMARGRSETAKKNAGELVTAAAREHLAPLLARRAVGLTLQVDEGEEVFDAKFGNLHALFNKS